MKKRLNSHVGICLLFAFGLCASSRAAERQMAVEPSARQVKRFEKIEFAIRAHPDATNPFDPNEVAIDLEFTAPSGKKITLPAFYYQPYERRKSEETRRRDDWLYPVGEAVWKARFAPAEAGAYRCEARLRDRAGEIRSPAVTFESLPSSNKGNVRVSPDNPRYLMLDDRSPLFVIGQNPAFVKILSETETILGKMGAQGANYARIWASCEDWGMCLEGRKNGWTRTWGWKPPVADDPQGKGEKPVKCVRISGDKGASAEFQPTRPMGIRPNTRYRLTGRILTSDGAGVTLDLGSGGGNPTLAPTEQWKEFQHEFTTTANQWWFQRLAVRLTSKGTAWVRDLSLREAAGGAELLWEADVNRPVLGYYHPADCFILDQVIEAAEQNGIRVQLVVLTRDLFMNRLKDEKSREYDEAIADAKRTYRYAIARWGYSTHLAAWEYFNEMDPGKPTDRFYREIGEYLEQADPYRHLRANSCWGPSKKDYQHPKLDTADMHYYMRPSTGELFKDAVESVKQRAAFLLENSPPKPALLSEFGMTDDKWMRTKYVDQDGEYVHLHDGLWMAGMSGLAGGALSWFWEDIEKKNMYHHYRPLATFVADIPYTTGGLKKATAEVSDKRAGVAGLQGTPGAWLWLYSREATWWKIGVDKTEPPGIFGSTLTIEGLPAGTYRVQWFDTWKGAPMGKEEVRAEGAKLELKVPAFTRDVAVRIVK